MMWSIKQTYINTADIICDIMLGKSNNESTMTIFAQLKHMMNSKLSYDFLPLLPLPVYFVHDKGPLVTDLTFDYTSASAI